LGNGGVKRVSRRILKEDKEALPALEKISVGALTATASTTNTAMTAYRFAVNFYLATLC